MSDLIDRQDVVELVKNSYYDLAESIEDTWAMVADVEKLPSAQPEPQWIPCSERLPEDVQIGDEYPIVIFCTKEKTYTGFYEYYLGGRWWTADGDSVVDGVIAWLPLPEPYKENSDE